MIPKNEPDDPRREFLVRLLAAGLYAVGGTTLVSRPALAGLLGRVPRQLPPGRSIYDLKGSVTVNGRPATLDTVIGPNDLIETGPNSQLIYVVGKDAFIVRDNSRLQLSGDGGGAVVSALRLVTGKLLSVFGKTEHRISTTTATIGIRGTGVYVESQPDESYVCTCYGVTDLAAVADPASTETIESLHHDAPRYILADAAPGQHIRPAPFKNHTDLELMLIEELVGRSPPFAIGDDGYGAPRRGGGWY